MNFLTPSDNYRWNQLGLLYQSFYQTYGNETLEALRQQLALNVEALVEWIDQLSDEELFSAHQRQWADEATKTAVWPVY